MKSFIIKNFLSESEISWALNFRETIEDLNDNDGVYGKNIVTTGQQWLPNDSEFTTKILERMHKSQYLKDSKYDTVQVMHARRAYDVHSDWFTTKNQIPMNDPETDPPTYTIIIPLTPGDFSTVVFEQAGKYNNFSEYKAVNDPIDQPITDEDWQKYCSHCHAEDQEYLTLHEVFNWQVGDLFAFDRTLFHCSANFETEKKAIVAWLSK
jgi:hypothetical protein